MADDDHDLQRVIKRVAEEAGYQVLQAFNGDDAWSLACTKAPDVILLDVEMPGLDGRDVLSLLKRNERTSSIPVLVYSGRDEQSDRMVTLQLGADDYIEKPLDAEMLVRRIGRAIAKAEGK